MTFIEEVFRFWLPVIMWFIGFWLGYYQAKKQKSVKCYNRIS